MIVSVSPTVTVFETRLGDGPAGRCWHGTVSVRYEFNDGQVLNTVHNSRVYGTRRHFAQAMIRHLLNAGFSIDAVDGASKLRSWAAT